MSIGVQGYVQGVQGRVSTLHTFRRWGRRDGQGVQGVQGFRAHTCACVIRGFYQALVKKTPRARRYTLHTLHTLHKRWESMAKHVQGCF